MTSKIPILGFRQDRIGARLICLLNTMRLARVAGAPARFLWLSQPGGPYPELVDPHDFLKASFVRDWIDIVDAVPDLEPRRNVETLATSTSTGNFVSQIASGQQYQCLAMSDLVRFMNESAADVAAEVQQIAAGLMLKPRLAQMLVKARAKVARAGKGAPVAIHVRRGDILDGDPWSYSSWSSKYVPDEYFRAFIALNPGPVIAFSDTPAAVEHLRQGNPRVIPVSTLFDSSNLTPAERDLLELLLMAGCEQVGAPGQSAYSRAAAIIGTCQITPLPYGLPPEIRQQASDALLARVIAHPDSFFAPGDQAQSAAYAATHAVNCGRGAEIVAAMADRTPLLARFPFLYRDLSGAALSAGQQVQARQLAQAGLAHPMLRNRDRPHCRQVLMVLDTLSQDGQPADPAIEAQFLSMVFTGRAGQGPIIPGLARHLLRRGGPAGRALMFDPRLVALCSEEMAPAQRMAMIEAQGSDQVLPLWALRCDWEELLNEANVRRDLRLAPPLARKLQIAGPNLPQIEVALAQKAPLSDPDDLGLMQMGLAASALRLHGRMNRAFALLEWLHRCRPGDALTLKRLADCCFANGNRNAGWRWLRQAMQASASPLLSLSAALRHAEDGAETAAADQLERARRLWPGLDLIATVQGSIRKRGPKPAPAQPGATVAPR